MDFIFISSSSSATGLSWSLARIVFLPSIFAFGKDKVQVKTSIRPKNHSKKFLHISSVLTWLGRWSLTFRAQCSVYIYHITYICHIYIMSSTCYEFRTEAPLIFCTQNCVVGSIPCLGSTWFWSKTVQNRFLMTCVYNFD